MNEKEYKKKYNQYAKEAASLSKEQLKGYYIAHFININGVLDQRDEAYDMLKDTFSVLSRYELNSILKRLTKKKSPNKGA